MCRIELRGEIVELVWEQVPIPIHRDVDARITLAIGFSDDVTIAIPPLQEAAH